MKFHFDENMYGTYREVRAEGASGRFDFTCRVEADGIRRFLRDRMTRLTGTANLEGVGRDLPIEGTLRIDPVFGRELVYDFTFRAGGSLYRFLGKKSVRFTNPVGSMTRMTGTIEKDGVSFADVTSRFDLAELPRFLLSFRLVP